MAEGKRLKVVWTELPTVTNRLQRLCAQQEDGVKKKVELLEHLKS
jgi:hypothetical protein